MPSSDTRFVHGAQRLGQRIATIRANLRLPSMVAEISELLLKRTLQRFDSERDPERRRWSPLTTYTLVRRLAEGYPEGPILRRSGELRGAIHIIRGSAAGSVYTNTGAQSRIGIDDPSIVPYAAAHQNGAPGLPKRRFLGISRLDVKAVDSLLRRKAAQIERTFG